MELLMVRRSSALEGLMASQSIAGVRSSPGARTTTTKRGAPVVGDAPILGPHAALRSPALDPRDARLEHAGRRVSAPARGAIGPRPTRPHRRYRAVRLRSLHVQILAVNALLVAATVVVAALSARASGNEHSVFVLGAALLATLAGNWLLLRRRFLPLERLIEAMEEVGEAAPGHLVRLGAGGSAEVERLTAAYNRMLARLEDERRQAGLATVRAQERERQRIAQDLHDEVNQALTAILLRLEASLVRAPEELRPEIGETKRLATQAMEELLQLARQLRPTVLDDHGLVAALHTQVEDFATQTGLRPPLHTRGPAPTLSPEQQLAIYRVLQESLSNVAQHAGATAVEVELSFVGRITLTVTDDGCGFVAGRAGGLGLTGMRERALLAGGRLVIRSEPGQGTRVELLVAPPDAPAPTTSPPTFAAQA